MAKRFRFNLKKETLLLPLFLIGLALLTGITTYLAQESPPTGEALVENSIYNNGPSGYRAWFLTAQKSGLPVKSWENGFEDIDSLPSPATMLIIKPYTVTGAQVAFGRKESEQLLRWVGHGNTLLLLDDFRRSGSHALANRLMLKAQKNIARTEKGKNLLPTNALTLLQRSQLGTYLQSSILSRSTISLQPLIENTAIYQPLLLDKQGKVQLWKIPYRKGTFILGTVTDLASNQYLNKPQNDNYQLLTNLLSASKAPVFVNEFVHGYLETGNLLSYFQKKTPLGSIFAQLTLFFFMLLWLSFIRWTPKPKEPDHRLKTPNSSGQEAYIQSLAGLYYRSKSPSLALSPLLNRIELELRKRFRLNLDDEAGITDLLGTLFANYSNTEESPASLVTALQKTKAVIRDREKLSQRDLLKLSRQLTLIEERLRHGTRKHASYR